MKWLLRNLGCAVCGCVDDTIYDAKETQQKVSAATDEKDIPNKIMVETLSTQIEILTRKQAQRDLDHSRELARLRTELRQLASEMHSVSDNANDVGNVLLADVEGSYAPSNMSARSALSAGSYGGSSSFPVPPLRRPLLPTPENLRYINTSEEFAQNRLTQDKGEQLFAFDRATPTTSTKGSTKGSNRSAASSTPGSDSSSSFFEQSLDSKWVTGSPQPSNGNPDPFTQTLNMNGSANGHSRHQSSSSASQQANIPLKLQSVSQVASGEPGESRRRESSKTKTNSWHQERQKMVVNFLNDIGYPDLNHRDKNGFSVLHHGVRTNRVDVIRCVLADEGFFSADAEDVQGRTALHWAARDGFKESFNAIMASTRFGMVDGRDAAGRTVMHLAARNGRKEIVEAVMKGGSRFTAVDVLDKDGWSALHCASWGGHLEVVKIILRSLRFSAVDLVDKEERTALHLAAMTGQRKVVEAILASSRFIAVNAQDTEGWTALHLAAGNGHKAVVEILLQSPRFTAADAENDTVPNALYLAAGNGHAEVVSLMLQSSRLTPEEVANKSKIAKNWAAVNHHQSTVDAIDALVLALNLKWS